MKISKIFGFVLSLHLGVIAILIVQPGCRTTQPPTHTYQQHRTIGLTDQTASRPLIPATRADAPIDSIFDASFNADPDGRYTPGRPVHEFAEFDAITPQLEPISSEKVLTTVDISGPSFETYTVKQGDSLWAISRRYNVSPTELYAANGLNQNSVLKIGQQIQIPREGSTATVKTVTADTYQPSVYNVATETHLVRSGDTLSKIASRYATSVSAIKAANHKASDMIRVGESLVIPVGRSSTATDVSEVVVPTVAPALVPAINASGTHTVKAGEYPATIARQYGMSAADLLAINGITDPRKIQIGQILKVNLTNTATKVDAAVSTSTAPKRITIESKPMPKNDDGPIEIRVVEADPLVETELMEIDTDAMFEDAIEIPVIRMEDQ